MTHNNLPHQERNRTYKFNGGRGAVLCQKCRTMVCSGLGHDEPCAAAQTKYHPPVFSEAGHVFCSEAHRAAYK